MMMRIAVRAQTAEILELLLICAIDVVNCHAVHNADATCPSIVSVQNRLRFVRYCSKFDIVFIHYDSYYHMLYESAY